MCPHGQLVKKARKEAAQLFLLLPLLPQSPTVFSSPKQKRAGRKVTKLDRVIRNYNYPPSLLLNQSALLATTKIISAEAVFNQPEEKERKANEAEKSIEETVTASVCLWAELELVVP